MARDCGADEQRERIGPRQQPVLFPPPGHYQRHVEPHDERHHGGGQRTALQVVNGLLEQSATDTPCKADCRGQGRKKRGREMDESSEANAEVDSVSAYLTTAGVEIVSGC